jgi:hypothetical protein
MSNLHPVIEEALAPFTPSPSARVFTVKINGDQYNVLAINSREAINAAINLLGSDELVPAEGLTISVRPA